MILVTVGTHRQPFPRLLSALGPLAAVDELVVQHGTGPRPREAAFAVPFMAADELAALMGRARVVVTHAGVGSFLCARRAGHVPVVVPRRRQCREHVDDHQAEFVRAIEPSGRLVAVWAVDRLGEAVGRVPVRARLELEPARGLAIAVRRALDGDAP